MMLPERKSYIWNARVAVTCVGEGGACGVSR